MPRLRTVAENLNQLSKMVHRLRVQEPLQTALPDCVPDHLLFFAGF